MNLNENISRLQKLMGLKHSIMVEQVNKKSSKGYIRVDWIQLDKGTEELFKYRDPVGQKGIIPLDAPSLIPEINYHMFIGFMNISKNKMPIVLESVQFSDNKGINNLDFTKQAIVLSKGGNIQFDIKQSNNKNIEEFRQLTIYVNFKFANGGERDILEIKFPYKILPLSAAENVKKEKLKQCKAVYNKEKMAPIVNWYKKWFDNPTTKQKFAKIWSYDNKKVESIFNEYKKILDQIPLEYTFSNKNNGAWVDIQRFSNGYGIPIVFNCSVDYSDPSQLLVHEIQHVLNDYHKLHPYKDNIFTFYKGIFKDIFGQNEETTGEKNEDLKNVLEKEGFKLKDILTIMLDYNYRIKNDLLHLENPNELMSELYEVRKILNLKPEDQITKQMLIDSAEDVTVFLSQWLYSKMTLNDWLNKNNSYALNKFQQGKKEYNV